jgi:predicted Zn-dependent protease
MIEAPCGACGTLNRIAESDLPAGAKFITCSSCKSRVAVPAKAMGASTIKAPAVAPRAPAPPKMPPAIPSTKAGMDLADLPAPKRQSALSGAGDAKPAPRSALADADLPAPKVTTKAPPPLDLDDLLPPPSPPKSAGLADLPAPKVKSPAKQEIPTNVGLADLPAPKVGLADLPAPKRVTPPAGVAAVKPPAKVPVIEDLPAPAAKRAPVPDVPAPAVKRSAVPDVPAPAVKRSAVPDVPAPAMKRSAVPDVPAPAMKRSAVPDVPVPAPKRAPPPVGVATKPGIADVPMPKTTDLPAPKPPTALPDLLDLPMPSAGGDLPSPKPTVDLPAPKGYFEDLPQPARGGGADLPAPKGYFEDLPQPARGGGVDLPAPKGFFDDLPQPARSQSDVPAPKGFFDDLPQPARTPSDAPATKGFFDDLPEPAKPSAPPTPTKAGPAPAPKGFFDDLPPPTPAKPSGNLFDDLAPPDKSPGQAADSAVDLSSMDLDLGTSGPSLELDHGPAGSSDPLLDKPADIDLGPSSYGDLDLSEPTAKSAISIKSATAKPAAEPAAPKSFAVARQQPADNKGGSLELELEGEARGTPAAIATAKKVAKKQQAAEVSAEEQAAKRKRSRTILAVLLFIVLAGAGGFYMYQRHVKAEERAEQIESGVAEARAALVAADAHHWDRAQGAAKNVIELDSDNGQALGIAAEAMLGGALDTGVNGQGRIASGRKMIADAIAAGHTGPELPHAQALQAIAAGQPDGALAKLQPLIQSEPKNAMLQLYLGWAQNAKGDTKAAIAAFDAAAANTATKIPALYGRGRAKLLAADLAGAKADFAAVLETAKDHIGAMVGLAETLPASQASQREADLLAVLQRKDIAQADPRAVVEAWSLAADVARRDGRLDVARERYRKALAISANDIGVLNGLTAVELRDNKPAIAAELIQKVFALSKDDPIAKINLAELSIKQGKLPDAIAIIKSLADRVPPLPPLQHAQLMIAQGHLLVAQGQDEDAVEAYKQGAKDAGDLDLAPTMAAVEKLGDLAKKASDPAKADKYRGQADELLSALATRAQEDPELSLALGAAYLQAGDPGKAEGFLRRATEMRGNDIQAKVELAKALSRLEKHDDAIAQLKAAVALDQSRADIALELARAYEAAKQDDDAHKAYDALVANKDAAVAARAYAGKFYARKGEIKKAAEQGDAILIAEPENPAGHYLKGEGLLAAGSARWDDARKELAIAVEADPDPQYLDAQGRIAEALAATGESKYMDLALRAYGKATEADPQLFNSWAGQGRVYVARKEWNDAVKPLQEAIKLHSDDPDVMFALGLCAEKLQQKKVAVEWFVKSGLKKPAAETSHHLGQLYVDLNAVKFAVQAFEASTRLGEEQEKQTGKQIEWLTEDYYSLGEWAYSLRDYRTTKRAYERYRDRHPPVNEHLNEVNRLLNGELKSY